MLAACLKIQLTQHFKLATPIQCIRFQSLCIFSMNDLLFILSICKAKKYKKYIFANVNAPHVPCWCACPLLYIQNSLSNPNARGGFLYKDFEINNWDSLWFS